MFIFESYYIIVSVFTFILKGFKPIVLLVEYLYFCTLCNFYCMYMVQTVHILKWYMVGLSVQFGIRCTA